MKLYYSPGACSLAAHIVLHELGEPFEAVAVRLADDDHLQPDFLRVNPRGLLPVLDADGFILTESAAILTWLAQRAPGQGLWPAPGTEAAARCSEWLAWIASGLHIGFAQIWRGERFCSDAATHAAIADTGRTRIATMFADVETRLAGRPWACGEHYSVADAYLLPFWRWGDRLGFGMQTHYPAWTNHTLRLGERPAVQRALAAEGITLRKQTDT